ncbi:MAG: DUF5915 domain-containing protein, partial [Kiritimatiellae bacterium]|nr:DUF5915 domain-containing protein [Kiritimatiellia bacterium]
PDELNVKAVRFSDRETELATLRAKPNFKTLGPRLGPAVKKAGPAIARLTQDELLQAMDGAGVTIEIDGAEFTLTDSDLAIERLPKEHLAVASEGQLVVALETELTEALVTEGLVREVINKVQNMRKEADYDVVQRIVIHVNAEEALLKALKTYEEYLKNETLAVEWIEAKTPLSGGIEWDINGIPCTLFIECA